MTFRKLLTNGILFIVYILILGDVGLFYGEHILPAAFILLFIVMFIHDGIRAGLERILFKKYIFIQTETRRILENLNDDLNSAVRYHEITRLLFEAFHAIFRDTPYAFYILENTRYYLSHYENIDSTIELTPAFNKELMSGTDVSNGDIACGERPFSDEEIGVLQQAGLRRLLPFYGHNFIFAFLLIDPDKMTVFRDESTRKLLLKIQKKAGLKLESAGLIIDLEKKNYETRKIIEVSQKILASIDPKKTLDFILDTLKTIVDFDAAAIFLLDHRGKHLLNTSSRGYDSALMKNLYMKVGQGACGWVVKTKKIDVLSDVRQAEHYYEIRKETRSQLSIPLIFEKEVLGVLCLESDQIAFFNEDRVDILILFANQASIAIHNSRQVDIKIAKQAFEHELIHAGKVQQRLLLNHIPRVDKLSMTALNIPSKIVSGDLYDITKFNDGSIGLAIGDVAGKGAPAALMMSLILAGLRTQNKIFKTTCDLVYRLNDLLCQTTIPGKYATFFYCIINTQEEKMTYTNAGHNPPLLFKADGTVQTLNKGGIVLGFLPEQEYIQEDISFKAGDLLIAYTDGVTEAQNAKDEEFGEKRLSDLIIRNREESVHRIKEEIIYSIKQFTKTSNPSDDITLIICKHL